MATITAGITLTDSDGFERNVHVIADVCVRGTEYVVGPIDAAHALTEREAEFVRDELVERYIQEVEGAPSFIARRMLMVRWGGWERLYQAVREIGWARVAAGVAR